MGGWVSPGGEFFPAPHYHHLRVAAELRATGAGPGDPWRMTDGWCMVRANGEALVLSRKVTQSMLNTLADMLIAAPDGSYRSALLASLRLLRELEECWA